MTYPIASSFDNPVGVWSTDDDPLDATEHSNSVKGFLATQTHVDVRNFRAITSDIARPQTDLDAPTTQAFWEGDDQTNMEVKAGQPLYAESWALSGTGLDTLTLGEISSRGGWSGLQALTTGAAVDATLISSVPSKPVDISAMTSIGFIAPDYNSFDSDSTIQFTSYPVGIFGIANDSAIVSFSSNLDAAPEFRFDLADFANTGFDPAKITAVQIVLKKASAPSASLTVTIMALRAVTDDWTESALDFDTILGAICVPVTLDGDPYGGTVAQDFQFVRGDGSKLDPIPADGAFYMYFNPGGNTSPNDATGADHNIIAFILREQKDTADGTGQHIEARLKWNDSETLFQSVLVSSTGGSPGTEVEAHSYAENVGPALDGSKFYLFRAELRGTQMLATLYETDINQQVTGEVWHNANTISDANYVYFNGRVGFIANLLSRDAYVTEWNVATTGYAVFQTEVFNRRSVVDGAQLAAVFSEDENLFQSATGPDLFIDTTKTLSGLGSFRTARSIQTNDFIIDDWTQSYLSLAIFVPNNVTKSNQPIILLNTGVGQLSIAVPKLQPAQWNALYFDLGLFRSLITANAYSLTISAASQPDRALGFFWIDEIVVGRRRVDWAMRCKSGGLWRSFKNMVNNPNGALHFTPEERGTELQIQATALTEDAWTSSFKLFPRIAELGLPVYDQGFEKS